MTREDKRSYFCISVILTFLVLLTIQSFRNDNPAMTSDRLGPPGSFSSSYRLAPEEHRQASRNALVADNEAAGLSRTSNTTDFE
jgi:hypothetical protein